ncbi:MAG: phage holin family protein [Clostridiales bacterium]|jgi:toxin secretion/phage lysis holin|nr:phage holin family protein [Clostridiales bacterium]
MKDMRITVQALSSAAGAFLGWFLGGLDGSVAALAMFTSADVVTGVMCGIRNKNLSSEKSWPGISKKILTFIMVGVAHTIDAYIIGEGQAFRMATVFFYLAHEGLSLVENAAIIGLPVPEKIKDALAQLRK